MSKTIPTKRRKVRPGRTPGSQNKGESLDGSKKASVKLNAAQAVDAADQAKRLGVSTSEVLRLGLQQVKDRHNWQAFQEALLDKISQSHIRFGGSSTTQTVDDDTDEQVFQNRQERRRLKALVEKNKSELSKHQQEADTINSNILVTVNEFKAVHLATLGIYVPTFETDVTATTKAIQGDYRDYWLEIFTRLKMAADDAHPAFMNLYEFTAGDQSHEIKKYLETRTEKSELHQYTLLNFQALSKICSDIIEHHHSPKVRPDDVEVETSQTQQPWYRRFFRAQTPPKA